MGKKNKGPSMHSRMMLGGYDRELERYGVEGPRFGRSDSGQEYRSAKDVEKDLINAARNDYDLRRTVEAAAMSGKKKAIDLQKKGFNSINDVTKWGNFSEKAAKRHGQGGDFSSASDYMGLTKSMVLRDRRKQDEGYEKQFASKEFLNDKLKELEKKNAAKKEDPVEYTESDEYAAAKERLTKPTNTSTSIFQNAVAPEAPTTAFREANDPAMKSDDASRATNSYLEQYKEDVIKGGRIGEARSANIHNAYNTVIGSDI